MLFIIDHTFVCIEAQIVWGAGAGHARSLAAECAFVWMWIVNIYILHTIGHNLLVSKVRLREALVQVTHVRKQMSHKGCVCVNVNCMFCLPLITLCLYRNSDCVRCWCMPRTCASSWVALIAPPPVSSRATAIAFWRDVDVLKGRYCTKHFAEK